MSNVSKNHQTLLVFGPSETNRKNRLKESVNGNNIKADIAYATKYTLEMSDNGPSGASPEDLFKVALAEARKLGYTQLVFAINPKTGVVDTSLGIGGSTYNKTGAGVIVEALAKAGLKIVAA